MIANTIEKERIDTEIALVCNVCGSDQIQKVDPGL